MKPLSLLRRLRAVVLAGVVLGAGAVVATAPQAANAAVSPDTCLQGYVWREAVAGDHVCVTPAIRSLAAYDNSHNRINPDGSCIQGNVWREATPTDHVCVPPSTRRQAWDDNAQAANRNVGNAIVLHADITFPDGVPVGGSADLTISPDGSYRFSGHFHDSGFPSYNTGFVWVLRTSTGTAFTFSNSGKVYGTIEPGSRDHNFNSSGVNTDIRDAWADIKGGYQWQWKAKSTLDLAGMFDEIVTVIGYVGKVVAVVGPLL